jgi:hypothetical protein
MSSFTPFFDDYVCADCGNHQDSMYRVCDNCQSTQVVLVSVAVQIAGTNYMDCFKKDLEHILMMTPEEVQKIYENISE